ncbi:hypothetical protein [Nocardioides nanhaiensis]|uniref:Uncharacterized protein n=1 Tax=Nocardioides nanhaiensis TaxID=1476871 RepID=A0ABP8WRQ1_9ACTN
MSTVRARIEAPPSAQPRVRHQARDAALVMAFSAACSLGLALGVLALTTLGR